MGESGQGRRARLAAIAEDDRQTRERRRAVEAELQAGHEEARRLEEQAAAIRTRLSEAEQRQREERAARDREYATGVVARFDADAAACRKALDAARRAFVTAAATPGGDTLEGYRALARAAADLFNVQQAMQSALGTLGTTQHNGEPFRVGMVHLRPYSEELDAALDSYRSGYGEDARHLADAERAAFINGQ